MGHVQEPPSVSAKLIRGRAGRQDRVDFSWTGPVGVSGTATYAGSPPRLQIQRLAIDRISEDSPALTAKTLQTIPLADLLAHCRAIADRWAERDFGAPRLADDDVEGLHLFSEIAGRGRRRSNAFYWHVAHGYLVLQNQRLANLSEGNEERRKSETHRRMRGLLSELAERLTPLNGGKQPSREEVRDWVHRARVLQLLTESASGEAGANIGPAFDAVYRAEVWPRLKAAFHESELARRAGRLAAVDRNDKSKGSRQ